MDSYEALQERIAELEQRLALFESKTGFMSAETMLENAKAWVARNPQAWKYLKAMAHRAITNQERFSIKRELEELRESNSVRMDTDDYKISNSYASVIVRLLIQEMPELREFVTLRRSKVDRLLKTA